MVASLHGDETLQRMMKVWQFLGIRSNANRSWNRSYSPSNNMIKISSFSNQKSCHADANPVAQIGADNYRAFFVSISSVAVMIGLATGKVGHAGRSCISAEERGVSLGSMGGGRSMETGILSFIWRGIFLGSTFVWNHCFWIVVSSSGSNRPLD